MASILTCLATSATWCCCTATASLLSACCGNDKPSTLAPGGASGRKRSVLLLFLNICLALAFQYGLAPWLVDQTLIQNFVRDGWLDGCEGFEDGSDLQLSCVGNNSVYRVSAATTVFFLLATMAAYCKPTANREAWPAKFILYLFMVAATVFIPSDPVFSDVYLIVARIGGAIFIIVQQLVILDLAHNWNDSWVDKSNKAEAEEIGSGKKWLFAILISCGILFAGTIAILIYMFIEFTGCSTNNAFIALTLLFIILIVTAQMTGDEGSLLSSGCISAWAAFLCHTAVSKNPNAVCNPRFGEPSPLSIAFGLSVTLISLCWTGWSYTAEDKLTASNPDDEEAPATETADTKDGPKTRTVTGIVTGGEDYGTAENVNDDNSKEAKAANDEIVDPSKLSNSWRLNFALAAVACWKAMMLTHWGEIQAEGTLANPNVGKVGMWMIIATQWLVMVLYVWSLVAPRLFPDRDFS